MNIRASWGGMTKGMQITSVVRLAPTLFFEV